MHTTWQNPKRGHMAVSKEQQHTFEKLVKGRKKERDNMFRKTTAFQNAKVKGE